MSTVLFRLWVVASVCWVGVIYWAFDHSRDQWGRLYEPIPWKLIFSVPAGVLLLGLALGWAFRGVRSA